MMHLDENQLLTSAAALPTVFVVRAWASLGNYHPSYQAL